MLALLGHIDHNVARIIGFSTAAGLTVFGGVLGFQVIIRLQKQLTIVTGLITLGYIALTFKHVDWTMISSIPSGNLPGFVGAIILGITGVGLGWVNLAADYSRYLARTVSSRAVVGWTVFGSSLVPVILVIYGSPLAGSRKHLSESIAIDPIGALTTLLPTWYLIPCAMVAVLALIGRAILDLYSSGLALLSIGLPVRWHVAASIDAVIMLLGTVYIVWHASDFIGSFSRLSHYLRPTDSGLVGNFYRRRAHAQTRLRGI